MTENRGREQDDEIVIRSAAAADLSGMLPLFAGYQRFYGAEPDDARNLAFFRRFVAPSDDGLLLGAWDGERSVGFATIYWTFSSTHAVATALMNDLFVQGSHRGRRIGERLIDACVAAARVRGVRHLEWLTAADNLAAQRLYDRIGAERDDWAGYEIRVDR